MKAVLFYLFIILPSLHFTVADKVSINDLKIITGNQWKGKLTYLDFSSGQKTSIPAKLQVQQSTADKKIFFFKIILIKFIYYYLLFYTFL